MRIAREEPLYPIPLETEEKRIKLKEYEDEMERRKESLKTNKQDALDKAREYALKQEEARHKLYEQ